MVLRTNNMKRVRGHKYITGLGDGDVKQQNAANNVNIAHQQRMIPGYIHYHDNQDTEILDKQDVPNGKNDIQNEEEDNPGRRSFLRRSYRARIQQKPETNFIGNYTNTKDLLDHPREYPGISNENWNRIYFPDQRQRKPGRPNDYLKNQAEVGTPIVGTGSNDLLQNNQGQVFHSNTLKHYYKNPLPQAADVWHFSVFFVLVATVILVIAMFLNIISDQYTTSTPVINSSAETKKSTPGNDNSSSTNPPKKFKNSGITSTSNRKIRQALRKPKTDEWNEDYDDPSTYFYEPENITSLVSNSTDEHLPLDDPTNTMNVYYTYQPLMGSQQHQQHRQRKPATIMTPASATTGTSGSGTIATNSGSSGLPVTTDTLVVNSAAVPNYYSPAGTRHSRGGTYSYMQPGSESSSGLSKKPIHQLPNSIAVNPSLLSSTQATFGVVSNQDSAIATSSKVLHSSGLPQASTTLPDQQMRPTLVQRHSSHEQHKSPYRSLVSQPSPPHDNVSTYTNHYQNRMLYARPLSTTASSFESLTEHPELVNPLSPSDSLGSYTDNKNEMPFYNRPSQTPEHDELDNSIGIGYDDENVSGTGHIENNAPLLASRSGGQNVRYRRREETPNVLTYEMGSTSFNRLISPGSDDLKYLLGLDQYGDMDANQNVANLAVGAGKNLNKNAYLSGQNYQSTIIMEHSTPKNNRTEPQRFPTYRTKTSDLLDRTPRVANGRQTILDDNIKLSNSKDQNASLPNSKLVKFPEVAEHPSLPLLQRQQQPFPQSKPGISILVPPKSNDDSNSTSFSDLHTEFSDTDVCMKFASPPKYPQELLDRDAIDEDDANKIRDSKESSIPFVPNLYIIPSIVSRPPESVNVDDLRLYQSYQLMETGNVSHWEARVAEESRLLHDHHKFNDAESFDSFRSNFEADDKILSKCFDDRNRNDNIRDQVMAVATDLMSSNDTIPSNDPRKSIAHIRNDLTHDTDAASSLQGTIEFSELKLIDVIGGGGFGQVWRAFWRGTPVAVKVLTGSAQSKSVPKAVLQEFAAEINLLKGMRHPNICLYMGACISPPNRAIITELAANGSLWDALRLPLAPPYIPCDGLSRTGWPLSMYQPDTRHGAPPILSGPQRSVQLSNIVIPPKGTWHWVLVKHVARGAARGMAYLHSGKPPVLHRDLKSANILLDESYTAKVCDFGLSRLKAHETSMTGNCGTVQWMAPEVLSNERYNEKADVFSYGIICWELLTAECPYDGMTPIQCALAVLNRDQRPAIPKWCPPSLQALIRSCWKRDPALRPTFEQVIAALDSMP